MARAVTNRIIVVAAPGVREAAGVRGHVMTLPRPPPREGHTIDISVVDSCFTAKCLISEGVGAPHDVRFQFAADLAVSPALCQDGAHLGDFD
eukprot:3391811-Prymnesium_polylepis.3